MRRHPIRELRRLLPDPLLAAEVLLFVGVGGLGGWSGGMVLALLARLPLGIALLAMVGGAIAGEGLRRRCCS